MSSGYRPAATHSHTQSHGGPRDTGAARLAGLCLLIRKVETTTCACLPCTGHSEALDSEEGAELGPRHRAREMEVGEGTGAAFPPPPDTWGSPSVLSARGCGPEGSGPPGPPGPESAPQMSQAPRLHSDGGWLCSQPWPGFLGTGPWEAEMGRSCRGAGQSNKTVWCDVPGLCDSARLRDRRPRPGHRQEEDARGFSGARFHVQNLLPQRGD